MNHYSQALDKTGFINYVYRFYGPGGIYGMGATRAQIAEAIDIYIEREGAVYYDSLGREIVRDIMIERFKLVPPM